MLTLSMFFSGFSKHGTMESVMCGNGGMRQQWRRYALRLCSRLFSYVELDLLMCNVY